MKKFGIIAFISALVLGIIIASVFSIGNFSLNLFSFNEKVAGSGNIQTAGREVSNFTKIDVSGVFKVEVTLQRDFDVKVEADDNLIQFIRTEVNDQTLEIESEKSLSSSNPIIVKVSAPNIEALEISGASKIEIANVNNDSLTVNSSGASKIKIEGITKNLTVDSSGASIIDADYLKSENAVIDSSGASKINVFVSDTLEVDLSGASYVYYSGSPKNLKKKTSGVSCVSEKK
jgi:hypothetical protein